MSEKNITRFEVKLAAKQGLNITSTIRTHTVEMDEPKDVGGTDKGPNPVELVLAALGGCQEIVLKFYAQKWGIDLQSVETTVDGDIDLGGFLGIRGVRPGFQKIRATTRIKAKGDPKKIEDLLRIAEERCPVLDILKIGVPTEVEIKIE